MYSCFHFFLKFENLSCFFLFCRYLLEHPEYVERGVKLSQFSFQIPRPLQENYVRKRPAVRMSNSLDSGLGLPRPLEAVEGMQKMKYLFMIFCKHFTCEIFLEHQMLLLCSGLRLVISQKHQLSCVHYLPYHHSLTNIYVVKENKYSSGPFMIFDAGMVVNFIFQHDRSGMHNNFQKKH